MSRPRLARAAASAVIATLLVSPFSSLPAIAAEEPSTDATVRSTAGVPETDQFIVKFKETVSARAGAPGKVLGTQADKLGIKVADLRRVSTGANVVKTDRLLSEKDAEKFLAGLEADPAVEYAEPDTILYSNAFAPDDPLTDYQWDLFESPYGLGMLDAWKSTVGEGVTVAVVDTGIVSHADLNANVLPGYDMIAAASISRDGDGRDANPRDEGDYGDGVRCEAGSSSWHGTHAAGTIAAVGANRLGITGVAPSSKLLPVRALGACGSGYTSDVIDGILWAAGAPVYGVPVNPNPAKVVNLSLGGSAACSTSFQYAIDQAVSRGSVIVAAAGNEAQDVASSSPANCENVISVASTGRSGDLAYYSNFGTGVDVSAPGGDGSLSGFDMVLSTVNSGTAGPIEDGTGDAYRFLQGTSMAAPHVSGVAALMLSANPGLTPALVEEFLTGTTRQTRSVCSNGCGTGIVDAASAVTAAVNGTFPTTREVTPAPVVFIDKDGVAEDTYTIPTTKGVDYLLSGAVVTAGTYSGAGTVTVGAKAQPNYVLSGEVSEWRHTFSSSVAPADTAGPTLISSSVDKTDFNLNDGPATFTVTVRLADASGAKAPVISVGHTTTDQSHGFGSMTLASGTTKDGTWTRTVTIPQGSAPGIWEVTLYPLTDTLGNGSTSFQTIETINITAPAADTAGPTLVSSSVDKTDFNLNDGPATFTVSVHLTDATGVRTPTITVSHVGTDQSHGFGSMTLASGTTKDGTWTRTVTIPQGSAPGIWEVTLYPLTDILGNGSTSFQTVDTINISDEVIQPEPELISVSPGSVVFSDVDGTAKDTYTIPTTKGVDYLIGTKITPAGTYPGMGTVTVTAKAQTGYVLTGTTEWAHIFKVTPHAVSPAPVVFSDVDGTAKDTYTVPVTKGVDYLLGTKITPAGTYPGTGTVTVTAKAQTGYVLTRTTEWAHTFKVTPHAVSPAPVVFTDVDGTAKDTYTIPVTKGVNYLIGTKITPAGTYPGTGTVTVTAEAQKDYVLTGTTKWAHTFSAAAADFVPPAVSPFADVSTKQLFYKEMAWLASKGISTGWAEPNGTRTYRALQPVNRDAMAAFLYRAAGSPDYTPPTASPFADISTKQLFYKEMAWLASKGISTGWTEPNGTRTYRALQPVNRDAMAAFLYRAAGSPDYTPPTASPFADISTKQLFYKEMAWLASKGISTGWTEPNGTRTYRALQPVNRDAMAAFLYRYAH